MGARPMPEMTRRRLLAAAGAAAAASLAAEFLPENVRKALVEAGEQTTREGCKRSITFGNCKSRWVGEHPLFGQGTRKAGCGKTACPV